MSGVVAGSAPLRQARRFSFWPTHEFPTRRRAISWEISLRSVKGHETGARSELIMGNGRRFEARKQPLSPRPLPIIGVRRGIMQCRAHDVDDRAAPAVAPGPDIPRASAIQPVPPEQACFFTGPRSVDSWTPGPKPLCHRHPTGPHPSGLWWTPAVDGASSFFALCVQPLKRSRGRSASCIASCPSSRSVVWRGVW